MAVPKLFEICLPLLALYFASLAEGKQRIVKPFPDNIHPIESENAQVTCVIFDENEPNVRPTKIVFRRRDEYGRTRSIPDEGPSGHTYFTNKTEDNGRKLFTTLHINNVTVNDDTKHGGRYECQGNGTDHDGLYGFSVTVILKKELPQISVSDDQNVKFGDHVTLICNLTKKGLDPTQTVLKKLEWVKLDGEVIETVRYPAEEKLRSLEIKIQKPEDGGTYICELTSVIRLLRDYNISTSIVVKVQPRFNPSLKDKNQDQILQYKGDSGKFKCNAEGNPIKIEWKRMTKAEGKLKTFNQTANNTDTKYKFSSSSPYQGFTLEVTDAQYIDRGKYYCCIKESNRTTAKDDVEGCQEFILRVKDPLGPLWPVIGIFIEVILLVIIIFIAEKRKKSKDKTEKADGRVEFSYSSTDDGDKGEVRLRQPGASKVTEKA